MHLTTAMTKLLKAVLRLALNWKPSAARERCVSYRFHWDDQAGYDRLGGRSRLNPLALRAEHQDRGRNSKGLR